MHYKISFCLVFISIFLMGSCSIFNGNTKQDSGIRIKTSTASGVAAMDVLQNENGIFILGIAKAKKQKQQIYYDFYLAKIDQKGQLLWEKTYGRTRGRSRPNDIISTSDNHLLLVGYTTKDSAYTANRVMHAVKVDYSGKIMWEKSYPFKYDNGNVANNSGNAVIEASDGYIIGGGYSNIVNGSSAGATLTKISVDGKEMWSSIVSKKEGVISGMVTQIKPDHFYAIGYFPGANLLSFKNTRTDAPRKINFTESSFSPHGIIRNDDNIIVSNTNISRKNGAGGFSLYKISQDGQAILVQKTHPIKKPYNRQVSLNIDALNNNAIVSTGTITDYENNPGQTKAYALKVNSDLSTLWQFVHKNASKPEEAIGAFELNNGGVGVIVNSHRSVSEPCPACSKNGVEDIISTSINSDLILYRLDKNGVIQRR